MPRTLTRPGPALQAGPARPWWARGAGYVAGTVRELRGTEPSGPSMRLVAGPDGSLAFTPTRRRERAGTHAARFSWRNRRTLAPLAVAAGYALLNATDLTGQDPRWLVVAALVAPLVAAAAWLTMLGGQDRTRATLTILALTVTALEVWWLLPDGWVPGGAVWVVGASSCMASAYRFRIREDKPMTLVVDDTPWQVRRWNQLVGHPGAPATAATPAHKPGLLPGSRAHFIEDIYPPADEDEDTVSRETPDPIGFRLAVELVPGQHEIASVRAKLGLIAGVYGAEKAGMVIDEVGNETRLKLTVTRRKFLGEVKPWTRPTLDLATGRFVWQTLADGMPGYGQLWIPGQGIRHFWVVGAMGGGKSGAVDCLLANLLSAGIAVLDLVDLKGGASVPHWQYRAVRFGVTLDAGIAALWRAVFLLEYRYDRLARMPAVDKHGQPVVLDGQPAYGRTWIDPSPEWVIYTVLIEEWTQLVAPGQPLAPVAIMLAARVAALGRAALVQLGITSQPANLDLAFGGNRDLRTNVQAGNVHVLWTDQGSGNLATATRTVDLTRIPQGQPGVGYLVGPGQPRDIQGRVPFVDDPWDAVRVTQPGALGPAELAMLAAADAYVLTGKTADARAAALAAFPDDPEWAALVDRVLAAIPFLGKTPLAAAAQTAPALPAPGGDEGVTWTGGVFGDPLPEPAPAPALPTGQQALLDLLAKGEVSAADMRAHLGGVSDTAMRKHLNPLLAARLATRTSPGRYALTPTTDPKETP